MAQSAIVQACSSHAILGRLPGPLYAPGRRVALLYSLPPLVIANSVPCVGFILLAYPRSRGLEGFVLQGEAFLVLLFASGDGKKQHQKEYARGPAGPVESIGGELAVSWICVVGSAIKASV